MKENKHTLFWLNNTIKSSRWIIVILMILQSLISFTNVINAYFLDKMIDGISAKNKELFIKYGTILLVAALIWLAAGAINRYLTEYGKASIENSLKAKLIKNILNRDYGSVSDVHSQEWMNKLTSDTSVVANSAISLLPNLLSMAVQLVSALIIMFKIIPQYAIILIPTGLILIVVTYFFRKKLKKLHKDIQESDGRLRSFVSEHLENLIVVKAFNKEDTTLKIAQDKMQEHKQARMNRAIYSDMSNVGFGALMRGSYVACLLLGGYGIYNGTLTYGSFIAMIQLIGQIQSPFANATSFIPRYYSLISSCERLIEVENYDLDNTNNNSVDEFKSIILDNVSFTYKSKDNLNKPVVLDNLNIQIDKNDFIALKGTSGSGKSTLLKVLMCLYPIDKGNRYIVDANNNKQELTSLNRNLFAYVPQGNQLMSGTIKDVVTFNNTENIDMDRFDEAIRIACADEFINELDKKQDYILGELGKGLSEGQMQRLAIARAIYSNKPIILLDEATSSLDQKTEIKLLDNLKKLNNRTLILVTHRNAALDYCDKVIEFK